MSDKSDELNEELEELTAVFSSLAGGVNLLVESINGAASSFGQFASALKPFVAALTPATIIAFDQAVQNVLGTVGQALQPALLTFANSLKDIAATPNPLAPAAEKLAESVPSDLFASLAGGVGLFVDAIKGATGAFGQLISTIKPFVAAFSPATVFAFDQAMQNVMATIGQALQPALMIFADMLQEIAASLDPLFKQLAPILSKLATVVASVLTPIIGAIANILQELLPFLDLFARVVQVLTPLVNIVANAFAALVTSFLPGDIQDVVDRMIKTFEQVIIEGVRLYAQLLLLVGAFETLKKLAASFQPKERVLNAEPQDLATRGLEDIVKQIAQYSAVAAPTVAKTNDEYMAEIADAVKEIAKGKSLVQSIKDGIFEWWNGVVDTIKSWIPEVPTISFYKR